MWENILRDLRGLRLTGRVTFFLSIPLKVAQLEKLTLREILVYLLNNCPREVLPMEYVLVKIKACTWQIILDIMF